MAPGKRPAEGAIPAIAGAHTPRATIYSVAELAGVSIATVSRVMQGSRRSLGDQAPEGPRRRGRAQLHALGCCPKPGRAPPRGPRARPSRAERSLTSPSCSWASSGKAGPERHARALGGQGRRVHRGPATRHPRRRPSGAGHRSNDRGRGWDTPRHEARRHRPALNPCCWAR